MKVSRRGASLTTPSAALLIMVSTGASPESRLYEVIAETAMPHLEENLRHASTRQQTCLTAHDVISAFPILEHKSLAGCALSHAEYRRDAAVFRLSCMGDSGTTGVARWRLSAEPWRGTLEVKLGGKNMTLYQRITVKPLGGCPP